MKSEKVLLPLLMYHEISLNTGHSNQPYKMTPMYYLSRESFEEQMETLSNQGYKSIVFEDIPAIESGEKYVIITFDDGLIGNARLALPILKKFTFKAIFFITVGTIGTPGYMKWEDLKNMVDSGMSIQSHSMTHPHLTLLKEKEIRAELVDSKNILESRLNIRVTSLSFPHGSYNQKVIQLAGDCGYDVMCTSEMKCNDSRLFIRKPVLLGRITVTKNMSLIRFMKLLTFDRRVVLKEKMTKGTKNFIKRMIGIKMYGKLYRLIFNIEAPSV